MIDDELPGTDTVTDTVTYVPAGTGHGWQRAWPTDGLTNSQLPLADSAVRAFNLHLYYEIRGRKSQISRAQMAPAGRG